MVIEDVFLSVARIAFRSEINVRHDGFQWRAVWHRLVFLGIFVQY
ncbi:hypothetical protein [Sinorhizobium sp. GL28]|nr:hypothetical protein [Sinorhizobium sp. GL28]